MSQPYLSLEAELHDAFWEAEDPSSELRLMSEFLSNHSGPALEVGSGSGRLLVPLIREGFDIEGLELSPDMISLCHRRGHNLGIQASVHQGDMTEWQAPRTYASVLAPAFTLQLASDPSAALRRWHQWLQPAGGLYLTVFMPYAELEGELPENEWYDDHQVALEDGRIGSLETRHRLDQPNRQVHREHRYTITGEPPLRHESTQTIRWIDHGEMLDLLKTCGFELSNHCADFAAEPATEHPDSDDCTGIFTYRARRI